MESYRVVLRRAPNEASSAFGHRGWGIAVRSVSGFAVMPDSVAGGVGAYRGALAPLLIMRPPTYQRGSSFSSRRLSASLRPRAWPSGRRGHDLAPGRRPRSLPLSTPAHRVEASARELHAAAVAGGVYSYGDCILQKSRLVVDR